MCGRVGNMFMVAGGNRDNGKIHTSTVELLNLDTLEWSEGPDLPINLADAASVVYEDSLYVFGGVTDDNEKSDKIFRFDVGGMVWYEQATTLSNPRARIAGVLTTAKSLGCDF